MNATSLCPVYLAAALLLGALPGIGQEAEPNGTAATATPLVLVGGAVKVKGNLYPNGDTDFYSFIADAGDRVYAATMTSGSAGSSTDSQLTLLASDGTTVIEFDDDNGSFAALSASIAGAVIPASGTYFIKVNDFTAGTTSMRGYDLYLQVRSGTPTPETESNDTPATANTGITWASGTRDPAAATEQDWYAVALDAGDTVFLSLDLNPERDGTVWNGRLGFALFGDAGNQILPVDDAGTGDVSPVPNNPSEAMFMTVKEAGTYYVFVDSASAAVGGPTATYGLNITVLPAPTGTYTTYTSTDVPKAIGPGTGLVSSTITIPGNPRIEDIDVEIQLNHSLMQDIDAHLRSPAGNDNGLFSDIGAAATGGQTQMDLIFDDDAAIPPMYTALKGLRVRPENNATAGTSSTSGAYRLSAFHGENAGGTWTLDLYDDTAGANGGTLTGWSIRIREPGPIAPGTPVTIFSTDFESGPAGFTHSGTQDEWELGLPATEATTTVNPVAAFTTAHSGVNCWKTDLDGTYNASSNQDLYSPVIDLTAYSGPVVVTWAMRHQLETATFDHMFVDIEEVGGASTTLRLYEWLDPTPISASAGTGNPQQNIGGSYGWGLHSVRADSMAGKIVRLRFHLDSDTTVQFGGLAIDDVSVTAYMLAPTFTDDSITVVEGSAPIDLATATGPDPAGGTFSGAGVDSMAGTFDPTGLALGSYTVTYTANSTSSDVTVTVVEAPGLTVTTTGDAVDNLDGQTTLREALAYAASLGGPQTVDFSSTTADGAVNFHDTTPNTLKIAIMLGGTPLTIAGGVSIEGPGADLLEVSGSGLSGVFEIPGTHPADGIVISGLTVAGGAAAGDGGGIEILGGIVSLENCVVQGNAATHGGGILNDGTLTVSQSTFSGNTADNALGGGGGVHNTGTLTVIQSTFAGNTASTGGGIHNDAGAALTVTQSTLVGNTVSLAGGGIHTGAPATVANSIVAGNGASVSGPDVSGTCTDLGGNLVGIGDGSAGFTVSTLVGTSALPIDPLLGPLQDNGGPTPTRALLPGSPAIDAGDNALAVDGGAVSLANDQRGFARVVKGLQASSAPLVDIGAYELFAVPALTNASPSVLAGGAPIDLATATGAMPPGGVFTGPGVSGGLFDPTALPPGTYALTYTVEDGFGGINSAAFTVTVLMPIQPGGPTPSVITSRIRSQVPKRFEPTEVGKRSRVQHGRIRHVGGEPARGLRVVVDGRDRADFKVTGPAKRTLAVGSSTTFRVTFRPRKAGKREAMVTVSARNAAGVISSLQGRGKAAAPGSPRNPDRLRPRE